MLARWRFLRITCAAAMGAFTTAACNEISGPLPDFTAEIASAHTRATPARRFHGWITGTVSVLLPFAPGSHDACNANFTGDPEAPGASLSVVDDSHGIFSHLGRTELHAVSCVDPRSPFSSGEGTLTAANGDQLFIVFENVTLPDASDPSALLVTGTQTVTGGTGRFLHAHGLQSCAFRIVMIALTSGLIEGTCEGELAY